MYDAIVLAGGTARRLGGIDKPSLELGGRTLLDRVVAAVGAAQRIVVVGPVRAVAGEVIWCREEPAGGGPVAAIAAGFARTTAEVVLVLAADLPWVAPAVPMLIGAAPTNGVALLADASGRVNNLAAAWSRDALAAALASTGDPNGVAVRRLVASTTRVLVPDTGGWGCDCDTWDDVAEAHDREAHDRQAHDREERDG